VRALVAVVAIGAVAALLAPAAVAVTPYVDTLKGVEVAATSTRGTFAGVASGSLPGTWTVVVNHTPLSSSGATITSGSFSIETVLHNLPTVVTGTLASGGNVSVVNPGAGCTNQQFGISAPLVGVGPWGSGGGVGTFSGTLTHYRHSLFGSCITYAATIKGGVSLTF